jgi:hypothetical protein
MTDFFDRFKKTFEEGLESVRQNAQNLREVAEEYSKVAKLKFELYQMKSSRDKKLTLLGETVYPYLLQNDHKGLKAHDTLAALVNEIKHMNEQIELLENAINDLSEKEKEERPKEDKEQLKKQITNLETEIEKRLKEIKAMKDELSKEE